MWLCEGRAWWSHFLPSPVSFHCPANSCSLSCLPALLQLFCKYYMKFTDMTSDEVEYNTCRDTFMTPEQAQDAGLIDEVS
jgi:hypothetical protein